MNDFGEAEGRRNVEESILEVWVRVPFPKLIFHVSTGWLFGHLDHDDCLLIP